MPLPLSTWGDYFWEMLVIPFAFYLVWAVIYCTINFVLAADVIKRRHYVNLYTQLTETKGMKNFLKRFGLIATPLIFMGAHFSITFGFSVFALLQFES